MRRSTLLAVMVALVAGALLYVAVSSPGIPARTNDADYEALITVHYTDGSSEELKRFATQSMSYNDKSVASLSFDVDVKWKPKTDDVKVLSEKVGGKATVLQVVVQDSHDTQYLVKQYPLSYFTQADWSDIDVGEWYHLFSGIALTVEEIESVNSGINDLSGDWHVQWRLDVWYSTNPGTLVVDHHEVMFDLTMAAELDVVPVDGGGTDDGSLPDPDNADTTPKDPDDTFGPGDLIIIKDVTAKATEQESETVASVPWTSGSTDQENLGRR